MTDAEIRSIAQATLLEAIARALSASQLKVLQQQHIVAAEETMERLIAGGMPTEQREAIRLRLEEQRLRLSQMRRDAPDGA